MKVKYKFLLIIISTLILVGCKTASENNLSYFRNLDDSPSGVMPQGTDYEIRVVPDDQLSIVVSSSVPEATAMFNQPQSNTAQRGELSTQSAPRLQSYVVSKENQTLISRLYDVIFRIAKEKGLSIDSYNRGIFDELPEHFEEVTERLIKEFNARGNN